jgi:sugar/nucleoside kinase (ribokinase family)
VQQGSRAAGPQRHTSANLIESTLPRRPAAPLSVRSALIPAPSVDTIDPTGCGDVFGAAAFASLLSGSSVEDALRHATSLAARNAGFRGATGLASHLRGELVTP